MIAEWVNPERLHDVWDVVKRGCEVVLRKTNDTWKPEDVYASVRNGSSNLFLIKDDTSHYLGFVVLEKVVKPRGPVLLIWILYGRLKDVEDDVREWLKNCRSNGGFVAVEFLSPRRWDVRPGVKLVQYVYELE